MEPISHLFSVYEAELHDAFQLNLYSCHYPAIYNQELTLILYVNGENSPLADISK